MPIRQSCTRWRKWRVDGTEICRFCVTSAGISTDYAPARIIGGSNDPLTGGHMRRTRSLLPVLALPLFLFSTLSAQRPSFGAFIGYSLVGGGDSRTLVGSGVR